MPLWLTPQALCFRPLRGLVKTPTNFVYRVLVLEGFYFSVFHFSVRHFPIRTLTDVVRSGWQRSDISLRHRDAFTVPIENDLTLEGLIPKHAARPAILASGHSDFPGGDNLRADVF